MWWTTDDDSKVGVLKSFAGADQARLVLFKADIYTPEEFDNAIKGCQYVFHVATPLLHTDGSQVQFCPLLLVLVNIDIYIIITICYKYIMYLN